MGIKVCLIGAHAEDNLAMGYLSSCLRQEGHTVIAVAFDGQDTDSRVARTIIDSTPDLVGISFASQHRALENIELASQLRKNGLAAHVCCGGQFPTAVPELLLENATAIDSVVLHEGELGIVELANAIEGDGPLGAVGALVWRDGGVIKRNPAGRVVRNLDSLPLPARDLPPIRDVGLAVGPILGSRGCRHKCSFCSIRAFADSHEDSVSVRVRSPENLAQEMEQLHKQRGVRLFQFHDDVVPLREGPDPRGHFEALKRELEKKGVERFVSICPIRPDLIGNPVLPAAVESLNIVRFYFGIESGSDAVLKRLGRGVTRATVKKAMESILTNDVPGGTNILLFDPESTLDDVTESLHMMRSYPCVPYNFCKVEAYYGTALYNRLEADGRLSGSWISPSYRLSDPAAEAACQISMHVMRDRISTSGGLLESIMTLTHRRGIVLAWDLSGQWITGLSASARHLIEAVSLDTTERLLEVVEFTRNSDYNDLNGVRDFATDAAMRCNEKSAEFYLMLKNLSRAIGEAILREG